MEINWPGENVLLKLWDTVTEKGIGKLLAPWQIGREGRANAKIRADELLLLAQAEADANDIRAGRKRLHEDGTRLIALSLNSPVRIEGTQLLDRVEPTLDSIALVESAIRQETAAAMRAEINTSRAVIFAEEALLASNDEVSNDPVDEDWLSTWRDNVSKVSSEDLQRLWGNALAGEVKNPGKYSLRTLDFLRTLSKDEAELISSIGPFVVADRIFKIESDYLAKNGLALDSLLQLQELGILGGVGTSGLKVNFDSLSQEKFVRPLIAGKKALLIEREAPQSILSCNVHLITNLGLQILSLGSFSVDIDYLKMLARVIHTQGFTVNICDWEWTSENGGKASNFEPVV